MIRNIAWRKAARNMRPTRGMAVAAGTLWLGFTVGAVMPLTQAESGHQAPGTASLGQSVAVAPTARTVPLKPSTGIGTAVHRMARCEEEDGSGRDQVLPCRWNDRVIGVTSGFSFVVTRNPASRDGRCFVYDDPKVEAQYGGCEL